MGCKGCHHRERDRVDRELVACVPFRVIRGWSGLSLGTLSRHWKHLQQDMGLTLQSRTPAERAEHGESLMDRIEDLISEAQDICKLAKADKKFAAASNALNTTARALEVLGKLTGEIALPVNAGGIHFHRTTVNTSINLFDSDLDLALAVREATKDFNPDEIARLKAIAERDEIASSSAIVQP